MIAALLLVTSITSPQVTPITLDGGCERMPRLLDRIAKQAKVELRCTQAFEDEVVFVSVKDKPLDLLLKQIAEVCHGDWRKEGDVQVLVRTATRIAQDEKDEQKLNLALIRSEVARQIRGAPKSMTAQEEEDHLKEMSRLYELASNESAPPEERKKNHQKLEGMSLVRMATKRLLATADFTAMASQPVWQTRLYGTNPNRFQYPLGSKVVETLGQFVKEQNVLINVVRSLDEEAQRNSRYAYGRYGDYFVPVVEPVSAHVEAVCFGCDDLHLEPVFSDADGYVLDISSTSVPLWPNEDPAKSFPDLDRWGSKQVVLGDQAKLTVNRKVWIEHRASPDPMAAKPAEKDPLSYLFSDPLSQLAHESERDLIAAIPDEIAHAYVDSLINPSALKDLCQVLVRYESVKDDGGTLLVAPLKRAQAFALRAKRKPLQDLIALAKTRPVTLDEGGAYAMKQNDLACATQLESYVVGYNQAASSSLEWLGEGMLYRQYAKLYTCLGPSQRTNLLSEGLRYSDLTQQQRDIFNLAVYSCGMHIMVRHSTLDRNRGVRLLDRISSVTLSQGIPLDTLIRMEPKPEKAALVVSPDGRREIKECGSIGYILFQQERGDFGPELGYQNIAASKLTPATENTYNFQITFAPGVMENFTLHDSKIESTASMTWKDLPPEWLKPLNDTLEYYRKMKLGRPGNQSPPPPRFR